MSELFDEKSFDSISFLKTVTHQPGVYRMYDGADEVIYVGKAKDLKKRLSSYFRTNVAGEKTRALVKNIRKVDVTVTHTETEALILEHNYIKLYLPKYNVLLRDDKSYPYIFLSASAHPRLTTHRGVKKRKGGSTLALILIRGGLCAKAFTCCKRYFPSVSVKILFMPTVAARV